MNRVQLINILWSLLRFINSSRFWPLYSPAPCLCFVCWCAKEIRNCSYQCYLACYFAQSLYIQVLRRPREVPTTDASFFNNSISARFMNFYNIGKSFPVSDSDVNCGDIPRQICYKIDSCPLTCSVPVSSTPKSCQNWDNLASLMVEKNHLAWCLRIRDINMIC